MRSWQSKIFSITNNSEFEQYTIEAFNFQYKNIPAYHTYCNYLNITPADVNTISEIPFLPIEFFKSKTILPKNENPTHVFTSSGTTGMQTSKHPIADITIYEESFTTAFNQFYGNVENYCVLALLPSYLERSGSSLVYMANKLIKLSKHPSSGFYLNNYNELHTTLKNLNNNTQKILLIGVTYALLDLAEKFPIKLNNTIIMETGGMKGRRKELIREELHAILTNAFGVKTIHSEYGMTELLSQAYSFGDGVFSTPSWMRILIRDTYDPFAYLNKRRSGGINVIDLANINSCCFIETKDIGKQLNDKCFTILGRFDNSDIRGCNLMVE